MMHIPKMDWNAIPWTTVPPGVERKGFTGERATVALHCLMPVHGPRPHRHPHEQIAYIIAGTIDFFIEGECHRLGPGSLPAVPPDAMHHGVVVGDEPVLNPEVLAPARSGSSTRSSSARASMR
jgi:quercetin dioxygenase-like cupin family protein